MLSHPLSLTLTHHPCTPPPIFPLLHGQVVVPETSQMLPEDLESGGVTLKLDTLNGAPLMVRLRVAQP